MKVLMAPADKGGCGFYRMFFPGRVLSAIEPGVEVRFDQHLPIRVQRDVNFNPVKVTGVGDIDADVLVLQRPLQRILAEAIPHFQKSGVTVVVDLDDDFSCLHSSHGARHLYNPRLNKDENYLHLAKACARADLLTVSTPALADRYGKRGNAVVLRNCVPERYTSVKRHSNGRTIGWSGFTTMHPDDLQVTRGGVRDALESRDRFLCVGNGLDVKEHLDLRHEVEATGPLPLSGYPDGIAKIDVGIVPLADTKFNAAKSWLKGLEFAAVGTSVVASPTAEYVELAKHIPVLLARRSREWKRHIRALLDHPELRKEWVEQSQATILRDHTYETQSWRWAEVWEAARQRMKVPA